MKEVYVVAPYRSAVGKAFRGSLANKRPDDLCAEVIKGVLEKAGPFDHSEIDDVIVGCAMPEAEQGMNVARFALLLAGLPESVPGVTVNRFCSSGIQTMAMAADQIRAGNAECILAGGTESMTMVPMMGNKVVGSRTIMDAHPDFYLGMGLTAENVASDYKITREEQDAFAVESHRKACEAIEKGLFKDEIIPIEVESRRPGENGSVQIHKKMFDQDEGPRPDTNPESLAKLRTVFKTTGSVTAATSSQMSDGAGMAILCSEEFVKKHNLKPMAKFLSFAVKGVPPRIMGIGPVAALPEALKRAGISKQDLDWIELNEAFASQSIAVIRDLELDKSKINPYGGAIALGHPLGATGAKLAATAIHGLHRTNKKYAAVTMCIGTGMGAAGVFERV